MRRLVKDLVVIALGGNAILGKNDKGYVEKMWRNIYRAAEPIVDLYIRGNKIIVTHGNGPQVGNILEWFECAKDRIPPLTMDIACAMTQGWIGYMLQQAIGNELVRRGYHRKVVAVVNQVLVSVDDNAFRNLEKFVGPYYSYEDAESLAKKHGWIFRQDPRGGWRRVVPSPEPLENLEVEAIKTLVDRGYIVIASGGGGVPVASNSGGIVRGVEAVIDKDLASSLLAISIGASRFVILTDIDCVYIDYGKPGMRPIRRIKASEALRMVEEGIFPPGSMGPKVKASAIFALRTGRASYIGHLDRMIDVFNGNSGTIVEP